MEGDDLTFCRLCLDVLKDPRQLPCYHSFCLKCLQNCELNDSDELQCPTCASSFEVDSDNLQDLKVDRFVQRLVLETKSQSEDFCYERFCESHPSAKINFFCVDCEVSGCPICSTGKHDHHRCIDLNEMGSVIRDELKSMSRDLKANLSWMNVQFCKEKQLQEERQKHFSEVSKEIIERGEVIKKAMDKQIENLLKQIEVVKKRCTKENELFAKKSKNLMENTLSSFISYIDKLAVYGLPEELIESVRVIKSRTDHLRKSRICNVGSDRLEVNFIPSNLHVDTLSLVGHIEITKSKSSANLTKRGGSDGRSEDSASLTANGSFKEDAQNSSLPQMQKSTLSLRRIPECHLVRSVRVGRNVAAVSAGKEELFVAIEHSGDVLRYDNKSFERIDANIKLEGLETPWDMTAINSDEMSTSYLFIVDNLQGKLFQVNVPYKSRADPDKFTRKVWSLGLGESVTLSSSSDKLLLASTANKITEYSLSSLLITSLSSSTSSSSLESSPLQLPEAAASFSVIPHMTDILHASRISDDKFVAFFDHLYSLSGGFLVNSWGKMVCSFGEGRGSIPSLQIDYPSHVAVDRKTSSDDAGVGTDLGTSDLCTVKDDINLYNDEAFIFLCDNGNDRITLFDGNLKYLKVAVEKVEEPWRVVFDPDQKVLFVATLQQCVKVFKYQ